MSVTSPSSTSGSVSIISNTRSAPASALIAEVNCCESCVMGMEKFLLYCRNDASEPISISPPIAIAAPAVAVIA